MLRRLEGFILFFAMLLTITLEGACVYWMWIHPSRQGAVNTSLGIMGEWTGLAMPQGWLLGALLALIYRVVVMLLPPTHWDCNDLRRNRHAFLSLWRWAIALLVVQGCALYLGLAGA